MARTVLGLLPEIRGGLGTLARAGQHSRFIDGYLKPYARAFDEIRYFSYLAESLADYTDDTELRASVRLLAGARCSDHVRPESAACRCTVRPASTCPRGPCR